MILLPLKQVNCTNYLKKIMEKIPKKNQKLRIFILHLRNLKLTTMKKMIKILNNKFNDFLYFIFYIDIFIFNEYFYLFYIFL